MAAASGVYKNATMVFGVTSSPTSGPLDEWFLNLLNSTKKVDDMVPKVISSVASATGESVSTALFGDLGKVAQEVATVTVEALGSLATPTAAEPTSVGVFSDVLPSTFGEDWGSGIQQIFNAALAQAYTVAGSMEETAQKLITSFDLNPPLGSETGNLDNSKMIVFAALPLVLGPFIEGVNARTEGRENGGLAPIGYMARGISLSGLVIAALTVVNAPTVAAAGAGLAGTSYLANLAGRVLSKWALPDETEAKLASTFKQKGAPVEGSDSGKPKVDLETVDEGDESTENAAGKLDSVKRDGADAPVRQGDDLDRGSNGGDDQD